MPALTVEVSLYQELRNNLLRMGFHSTKDLWNHLEDHL